MMSYDHARIMANAAYEAIFVLDAESNVVAFNDAARATFSVPNLQIGTPLTDVINSSDLISAIAYARNHQEHNFEVQIVFHEQFYRAKIYLAMQDDTAHYTAVALQNVTELVRLNRARRDMVANISHELRTPIANIRLTIESLFAEDDKPKRKKSIESLKTIARETDSLLWLVQELLDLSMIETGQSIVRMIDTPLQELLQSTIQSMGELAENRQMTIELEHASSIYRVLCDPDLIKRVLVNLIHNGLKYSPMGGIIKVMSRADGDFISITVQDTGSGIPADQVERVFERFYQLDRSRSANEGTGLGLAICKHIVEAHGGEIWAEPAEKVGCGQFSFTLLNADDSL